MNRTAILGIVFLVGIFGVILYTTMQTSRYRVKVCMQYQGLSNCAIASGASEKDAKRAAITTACAIIAGGVTGTIACESSEPGTVEWLGGQQPAAAAR